MFQLYVVTACIQLAHFISCPCFRFCSAPKVYWHNLFSQRWEKRAKLLRDIYLVTSDDPRSSSSSEDNVANSLREGNKLNTVIIIFLYLYTDSDPQQPLTSIDTAPSTMQSGKGEILSKYQTDRMYSMATIQVTHHHHHHHWGKMLLPTVQERMVCMHGLH